jgi:hypothetical protein
VDTVSMVDACAALGVAVGTLVARVFGGRAEPVTPYVRECGAKLTALEELLKGDFSREDDGPLYRELWCRFGQGLVRLMRALHDLLSGDWTSNALRLLVRCSFEQMQGAGYYLKVSCHSHARFGGWVLTVVPSAQGFVAGRTGGLSVRATTAG